MSLRVIQADPEPQRRHAEFQIGYIWVALAAAVFAGFAIGAHLAFVIGYGLPLGRGFSSFVQTHGHVQLIGWAGLFIIGVSLHFIPRLASVPIAHPQWIPRALWLIATGLLLRSIGQTVLPYLTGSALFVPYGWMVAASGLLEWGGILIYLLLLVRTLGGVGDVGGQPALFSVRPYFGMMLTGWLLYASLNLLLLLHMIWSKNVTVNQGWGEFAIQVFIGLVLLPVAFAFSVRLFPLFLNLAPPDWPVRTIAYAYLFSWCLQVVPTVPPLPGLAPGIMPSLSSLGMLPKGGVILWFVWELDLLIRRREPWTVLRSLQSGPDRRPTRGIFPDYGEYGRFERLIYSAYIWLVLAALFEMLVGAAALLELPLRVSSDAIRHMYLLGFITHLIFGVSVRMIPGFMRKKQVASTRLVDATFWLGNTAALCRVFPLLLPPGGLATLPGGAVVFQTAFAISGIIGLMAVSCLAVNLWKSVKDADTP